MVNRFPTVAINERMKDANAAIKLLEKCPEKISGSEWDSNPRPHESGRVCVRPYMFSVILSSSI